MSTIVWIFLIFLNSDFLNSRLFVIHSLDFENFFPMYTNSMNNESERDRDKRISSSTRKDAFEFAVLAFTLHSGMILSRFWKKIWEISGVSILVRISANGPSLCTPQPLTLHSATSARAIHLLLYAGALHFFRFSHSRTRFPLYAHFASFASFAFALCCLCSRTEPCNFCTHDSLIKRDTAHLLSK